MAASAPLPAAGARPEGSALGPYLRAISRHKLIVAMVTLACVAGAVVFLALRTPTYDATAEILVSAVSLDDRTFVGLPILRDAGDPTRTMQTAASLLASPAAAQRTAGRLGGGATREDIEKRVSVQPEGDSNILSVTGSAETPEEASELANLYAVSATQVRSQELRREVRGLLRELRAQVSEQPDPGVPTEDVSIRERISQLQALERGGSDPTLTLAARANPPDLPTGAGPVLVVGLALIAGLALGSGLALLLQALGQRINTEDDALELYGLPVLTRVPFTRLRRRYRKGAAWFAMPPLAREAYRTLQVQISRAREDNAMSIMVTSPSTGDGKTTSAVNLAVSLAAAGNTVVLLDFDLRKPDVANRMPDYPAPDLPSLIRPGVNLKDLLRPAPSMPQLLVMAPRGRPADQALVEALYELVPTMVRDAKRMADYVIVDTAPLGEVSDALRLVDLMDEIVVVIRGENTQRRDLLNVRDLLERTDKTPLGLVAIGLSKAPSANAYGYGQSREMFRSAS